MLQRKLGLFSAILLAVVIITPKNAYAGTCTYTVGNDRMAVLNKNDCDPATEFPSVTNYSCTCVKKAESGLAANTCECVGNTVNRENCQSGSSNALCVRGTCVCSQYTNLVDLQNAANKSAAGTTIPHFSQSNPFTGCSANSINTALGCIPVDMNEFIKWLLPFLFGIAGGISFLLMVYGFILITLSKGDPKKVQGAKETITSAITGLLLSIFSLFILRLIVSGILKLPGVN